MNIKKLNTYIPITIENSISYIRDEKSGATIIASSHPELRELSLNKIAKEILTLCDSKNSLYDIYLKIYNKYDVDEKKLYIDLLNLFLSLYRVNIIGWKENIRPFENVYTKKVGKYIYRFMTEKEVLENYKFNDVIYTSPYLTKKDISKDILPQMIIRGLQNYFELVKDEQVLIQLSLNIALDISGCSLETLICNADVSEENLKDFFNWCISKIITYYYNQKIENFSISAYLLEQNKVIEEFLSKIGFKFNSRILKEIGSKDLLLYEYKIKEDEYERDL